MNNISKTYVDMLRYTSACGKKSIIETARPILKKGAQLKYAGPVEYKTVPIGMPMETPGMTYAFWNDIVLKSGENKSYVLESWFELITPREHKLSRIEQELRRCLDRDNIDKIEFFKTLSSQERDCIATSYPNEQFFATLSGHKPAWYCEHGFSGEVDFSKIKLNPKIADKYDVVTLPDRISTSLFFLNKQEVLKIIEENKDLYCAGQGLNPSENIEVIYQNLIKNLQNGNLAAASKGEALFGITLGFPRHSSMIHELDRILEGGKSDLQYNIPLFKSKLLEVLHSEKSPYRNYPKETLERLENHIKTMTSVGSGSKTVCQCATYGNEEEAVNKLLQKEHDFEANFKMEDLM